MAGRQILDCALIANKSIDWIKKGREGGLCFKVDFEKAYDTLDWYFLQFVMQKMGFGEKWIGWITSCVSTASLSILVNGSAARQFRMKRGLRQGCPPSPFLFNMVAEVLSIFLRKVTSLGLFEAPQIGNVSLSHLQYADDIIIFYKAAQVHLLNVKRVLRCFQIASGLKINFAKSSVIGVKVVQEELQSWAAVINCKVASLPCTYLGLPLGAQLKSRSMWQPVLDKFRFKLDALKAKFLSFGGRVTLIKFVLAALPLYYMSILPIPSTVKDKMEKIMRKFL